MVYDEKEPFPLIPPVKFLIRPIHDLRLEGRGVFFLPSFEKKTRGVQWLYHIKALMVLIRILKKRKMLLPECGEKLIEIVFQTNLDFQSNFSKLNKF